MQIHVMSAISGVEWDEAWPDRVEGTLGRNRVSFLGRGTLFPTSAPPVGPRDPRISTRSNRATSSGVLPSAFSLVTVY